MGLQRVGNSWVNFTFSFVLKISTYTHSLRQPRSEARLSLLNVIHITYIHKCLTVDIWMEFLISTKIALLLLLLSHFSRVRLCATPSLGFSRQEHWSGLPFPSSMHESGKWKWSCSVVSNSSQRHGLQPTGLLRPLDFLGKSTGVGCHCLVRNCTK